MHPYLSPPPPPPLSKEDEKKKKKRRRYEGRMGREGVKSRRTFTARSLRCVLTTGSLGALSLVELSQTKPEEISPITVFANEGEFLNFLKYEFPNLQFVSGQPSLYYEDPGEPDPDLFYMGFVYMGKLLDGMCVDPEETTGEIVDGVIKSTDYVATYQKPRDKTPGYQRKCNNDASLYCETLDRPGVPMHYLSTFPYDTDDRFNFDWHQQAFCKLGPDIYIIFNNNGTAATYWKGTLQSYVIEYKGEVPMGKVSYVGFVRYERSKYDNGLSRMLVNTKNRIPNENEIECVNIERGIDSRRSIA